VIHAGIATAGFQVEGGYNAPGEPTNNWADWERDSRVERSGRALRFWDRPAMLLDRAAALGCDRFRLSIEWARVQPGFEIADASPPPFDETAFDGYVDLLVACRERGMEPMVTLHHFTHPRWIGIDLWGVRSKLPFFEEYVTTTVGAIGDRLVARGHAPVHEWITLNELNALALAGGLVGAFPPGGRPGPTRALRWLDHLLGAHCLTYDIIHDIYEARGWDRPAVSTNNYVFSIYALDRMLTDLLLARENGVKREELPEHLADSEAIHRDAMARAPGVANGTLERAAAQAARRLLGLERLAFTLDVIEASHREEKLDFVGLDWYDPSLSRQVRLPGRVVNGRRRWSPRARLDEQVISPPALRAALCQETSNKPVVVVESGLCSLRRDGQASWRPDGISRLDYLRLHLAGLRGARRDGAPLTGYYHWTIADNYEWGSYAPRFGIHGVDRSLGEPRILDEDAMGHDAAGCFRRMVDKLREE
jgi:beta-glucosidase